MKRAEVFALLSQIAFAAEQAAMKCGASREYDELRAVIERNEREHRAFGRRLVGPSATRGRFSVSAAVDLFVVKVLSDGLGVRRVAQLIGVREDCVRGAILVARHDFRAELAKAMNATPRRMRAELRRAAELADYSALANGGSK